MSNFRRPIKAALLQVHSIIGLAMALLFAVVGITGAIMGFEDEIEAGLNSGIMRVDASATPRLTPMSRWGRRWSRVDPPLHPWPRRYCE